MQIGFLHARIRQEEKLLLAEFESRGVDVARIHIEDTPLPLEPSGRSEAFANIDVVLERCISHSRASAALRVFQGWQLPCINPVQIADVCGDKLATNVALLAGGVPVPKARVAFTPESALDAIEELGYPAVLKPAVGSWGRLLSRVHDRESAETVLEHKATLGSYHHSIFYIQEHIDKPGRDLRSFVVGDKVICAIARHSEHWITNTAKGSSVTPVPVTDEMREISLAAAAACGGGILAVDLFETPNGLIVNEVNYTMEFKNSIDTTGVNIPAHIVDYVLEVGEGRAIEPPQTSMSAGPSFTAQRASVGATS